MKCFPFMKNIEGARCLLVGGGNVAVRKAEMLLHFGVRLSVCAKETAKELAAYKVSDEYFAELLEGMDFVIAATNDTHLNAKVASDCRQKNIPVNAVDDKQNCDFYFPAVISRGALTIGISTGGASPALAAAIKKYIEDLLPENMEEIVKQAESLRGTEEYFQFIQGALPKAGK